MTEESGSALEIERKLLLSGLPPEVYSGCRAHVQHGWLPGDVIHERLTIITRDPVEYWRCVKTGKGLVRVELQEKVEDKEFFFKLWPLTEGKRVEKIRYKVKDSIDQLWEIDLFLDRSLILAEIELKSEDARLVVPPWLTPYVVKEVTDDPGFLNYNLALPK
jgi:CYTH domain-containing protein